MDRILAAAKAIALARRNHAPLAALEVPPADEAEGYQVQRALHDLLLPHAGPLVGYKIGCTSQVMQDYIGIPHIGIAHVYSSLFETYDRGVVGG